MPSWIIPALIILGMILLYLEFFLPGGLLAAASALLLIAATILVFIHYGAFWGSLTGLALLLGAALLLRCWMARFHRTFLGKRLIIHTEVGKDAYLTAIAALAGRTGRTLTALRPSGKALIDGERYDVVSALGTIPAGTPVQVTSVDGIRITVTPVES